MPHRSFLRHADIGVTAAHYADHKERVTVDMGALLNPQNVKTLALSATDHPKRNPGRISHYSAK